MTDIEQLTSADEKSCVEINALLAQLSKERECTLEHLKKVVKNSTSELWVAIKDGNIVGMATLALIVKPAGVTVQLEDVVVDESARGQGLGRKLCEKVIERAKVRGASSIHLTSRPSREAANVLYQKLGFVRKETNVYRMTL